MPHDVVRALAGTSYGTSLQHDSDEARKLADELNRGELSGRGWVHLELAVTVTDDEPTRDELIADQLETQPWRPHDETVWLVDWKIAHGERFCAECHDWHDETDEHSTHPYA